MALGGKLFGNTLLRFDLRSETVTSSRLYAEAASIGTTPDGKNVITYGNAIRFFDPDTLEEKLPYPAHGACGFWARYSGSGHRIATRDDEAKLRVWDSKTGEPQHLENYPTHTFSRLHQFVGNTEKLATVWNDQRLRVWDCTTGRLLHNVQLGPVRSPREYSLTHVRLKDYQEHRYFGSDAEFRQIETWVNAFRHDGRQLIVAIGGTVQLWNLSDAAMMAQRPVPEPGSTPAVGFSKAGGLIQIDRQWWDSSLQQRVPDTGGPGLGRASTAPAIVMQTRADSTEELVDQVTERVIVKLPRPTFYWSVSLDGRILAISCYDCVFVEVATGQEIGRITGKQGGIHEAVFSPDGRTVTTLGWDTTIVVWDWARACLSPRNRPVNIERAWAQLAEPGADKAFAAMRFLEASPQAALNLLERELKPYTQEDEQNLNRWIEQVNHDRYAVRDRATRALVNEGRAARPILEAKLTRKLPPETENRIQGILRATDQGQLSLEELRQRRAIQVLEWLNTPASRALLLKLSLGGPKASRTVEAQGTVIRLGVYPGDQCNSAVGR